MVEVKFYDTVNDELLKFAVIISQSNGKWVFCKHKERDTYEVPGGHREDGEDILETAKRELYEETGAITFDITPICIYSVTAPDNFDGMETFGKLFFSDIYTFEKELHSEIEKIAIMDELLKCTLCQGHYDFFLFRFLFYICLLCRGINMMPLIDCFHLLL